ncbi:MAG: hypothetical protein JWQ10_101 [Herbaspirillum sp.]|nr:hypothetical protein [Herbaspirillum sp.]
MYCPSIRHPTPRYPTEYEFAFRWSPIARQGIAVHDKYIKEWQLWQRFGQPAAVKPLDSEKL